MRIGKEKEIWIWVAVEVAKTLIDLYEKCKRRKNHDGKGNPGSERQG